MFLFFKREDLHLTPAPSTPPVIRVVLLHTEQFVESLDSQTVFSKECEIYFEIKHTTIL